MKKSKVKSEIIPFRLSNKELAFIKSNAEKEGLILSEYIRRALFNSIKNV